jgi:phosphate starvation-inducible PhoH-like protein
LVRRRDREQSKPKQSQLHKSKYKKEIKLEPKTDGQSYYLDLMTDNDITICDGKAGTGKTLLAVGMALSLLKERPDKYRRIVMVRPAVTVKGEDLGFLPGDIEDKMKPFMMPMLDSLKFFMLNSDMLSLMDSGVIEISTIAHMRGRTFNNCIIIFDEAQNSTFAQMKMVVTRIGFNTKLIIEGDISQSDLDLETDQVNGLEDIIDRFQDIDGVGICNLGSEDIVRSPILSRIIETYD